LILKYGKRDSLFQYKIKELSLAIIVYQTKKSDEYMSI